MKSAFAFVLVTSLIALGFSPSRLRRPKQLPNAH
jgi:hypothetical protein